MKRFSRFLIVFALLVVSDFGYSFTMNRFFSHAQADIDVTTLSGEYDPYAIEADFHKQTFITRETPDRDMSAVLGTSTEKKLITVDLSKQKLYAFEGERQLAEFDISSGKWGRTPTGTFTIWSKFRYTKMSGGSRALGTYYYLPNVPYVMFFSNNEVAASRGFSIHGTYWHDNFGTPMSHGCINMRTEDVEKLYYWATPDAGDKSSIRSSKDNPGTEVIIYGEAPQE